MEAVSKAAASFRRVSSTLGSSLGKGTLSGMEWGVSVIPSRRHFT